MAKRKRYAWRPIGEVYPDYKRDHSKLVDPATVAPVVPMAAPITVSDVLADLATAEPQVAEMPREEAKELMKELDAMAAYHNV